MKNNVSRRLNLEGASNFRDLGGIMTGDGRKIASKRLVRSGLLSMLTSADFNYLNTNYNIKKVYDFRLKDERKAIPDPTFIGAEQIDFSLSDDNITLVPYPHEKVEGGDQAFQALQDIMYLYCESGTALDNMKGMYRALVTKPYALKQYSIFLNDLLNVKNGCTIYHCFAGKDRTGIATVFILMALGVKREYIIKDYMSTKEYLLNTIKKYHGQYADLEILYPELLNEMYKVALVDERWLNEAFKIIDEEGGELAFLENKLNFNKEKIESFRNLYLV